MPLTNCGINLDLHCSKMCVVVATNVANQAATFSISDTKLYVPVVTLLTQNNAKLPEHLKSGFNRTSNWNKYQSKISTERPNQYSDYFIDPSFQGANRPFALLFENNAHRTSYTQHFLPTVEIKDYNVMIDGKNLFDQPVRNILRTCNSIQKISTGRGDDYTTGCLLN